MSRLATKMRGVWCAMLAVAIHVPAVAQQEEALSRWEAEAAEVTIHRDTWGVPHIFGPTDASVMFGAAYARAEDQLLEDEPFFLAALGRSAELSGEAALDGDRLRRASRPEARARREYDESEPVIRAMAEAYADGVNYYLHLHPEVRWEVLDTFEPWWVFAFHRLDPGVELAGLAEAAPFRPLPAATWRSTCPTSSTCTATRGWRSRGSPPT